MAKRIRLTKGKTAIVDDDIFEYLNRWKWIAAQARSGTWYAQRTELPSRKTLKMHRIIMNAPNDLQVDHINMNGLDNRRKNLRLCTVGQNCRNRKTRRDSQTGYKGVSWREKVGKYQVRIQVPGGRRISLGYFDSIEIAAMVYDSAAKRHHGTFAKLNFPDV